MLLSGAAIQASDADRDSLQGADMNRFLAASVMIAALAPSAALAQERAGDAALGALSGGLLLGPIGAVAGGVVGYAAGPAIAQSWGLRRNPPPRHPGRPAKRAQSAPAPAPVTHSASAQESSGTRPLSRPPSSARSAGASNAMPPVQALE